MGPSDFFLHTTIGDSKAYGRAYVRRNDCIIKKELKAIWVEEWARSQDIQLFSYDLHCIETKMFDPNGKNI